MEKIYNKLIKWIQNYCENTGCRGFVLGVSGGKDSTVIVKLLVDTIVLNNVIIFWYMLVIKYKTELGDLCKVNFTIDIQDPEIEIEFSEWLNRCGINLPQNKTVKKFGSRSYLNKETNRKEDWLVYNVAQARSAIFLFILSKMKKNY